MIDNRQSHIPAEFLDRLRHERTQAASALASYAAGRELIFRQIGGGPMMDVTHEWSRHLQKIVTLIDALL